MTGLDAVDDCYPIAFRTSEFVKGCRTPAVTMWLRRTGLAGVGQASGEETAGSLRSLFRLVQPMGI